MTKINVHLIPLTEEVREIEAEELEARKIANNEFIRNNVDKYLVDVHGNFCHIDSDMMDTDYYYIGKGLVHKYERVKTIMAMMIINEKDDEKNYLWEIKENGNYYHKKDGKIMFAKGFSDEQNERIKKAFSKRVSFANILMNRGREGRSDRNGEWVSLVTSQNNDNE
ncbi:hypothetical protein [endosymbiont GvMRE of Glomus versiforme]|uniref:hypothetical protein n=1 Tax=endosymbiont GvMRE of Glomus versiforme TaxID=2039283 RepID=UPI000EBE9CCE|nr:hypothetical protein [endosymbiont GvMRE of Glomus versiforme]RHZ35658.1 hypothetical protein GvMRE_IIg311 [endosymbiont GvMRE of Glomus versiforme]